MRRSAAQLHALAKVEREIRATDPHPRRKYLRDFTEAYTQYSKILEPQQLAEEFERADILLVGDYHALPKCQQFAAELVENLRAAGHEVVLGLEMIFARDQRIVNEWREGRLSDEELRQRTKYDQEWGYDWEPTHELLTRAKGAGALVRGLDCLPRGDLRRIARRDRHAALEIADIRFDHPEAKIVVLFGESHLAPQHLPKLVRTAMPGARVLTVLQNVDALYWQASGEPGDAVRAVRVDDVTVCVFNATPLEKYERYRLCIEYWKQERPGAPDLAPSFYNLVNALLRVLKLDEEDEFGRARLEAELLPSVISVGEGEDLLRVLECPQRAVLSAGPARRQPIGDQEIAAIRERLRRAGICYLPALNTVLVQRFEIGWAAEEAARFICCAG
ncbi:MAG TPA: ChaN family lipoprotein, partial [Terriglobales bacterium]|nr:ChaN family lipoprotein [Terriglobales bacterium]